MLGVFHKVYSIKGLEPGHIKGDITKLEIIGEYFFLYLFFESKLIKAEHIRTDVLQHKELHQDLFYAKWK